MSPAVDTMTALRTVNNVECVPLIQLGFSRQACWCRFIWDMAQILWTGVSIYSSCDGMTHIYREGCSEPGFDSQMEQHFLHLCLSDSFSISSTVMSASPHKAWLLTKLSELVGISSAVTCQEWWFAWQLYVGIYICLDSFIHMQNGRVSIFST